MADRLGLGTQVRELKIGQSFFTQNGQNGGPGHKQGNHRGRTMGRQGASSGGAASSSSSNVPTFHTIRYDFKPASVDQSSQDSKVSIAPDGRGVTVEVPNLDGGVTNYSGHMRDSGKKDCVLIIDHDTGEITIERLTKQIVVKKTRPERPEKSSGNGLVLPSSGGGGSNSRPSTPFDQLLKKGNGGSNRSSPSYNNFQSSSSRHGSRSNSPAPPPPAASQSSSSAEAAAQATSATSDFVGFDGLSTEEMFQDFTLPSASANSSSTSPAPNKVAKRAKKPPPAAAAAASSSLSAAQLAAAANRRASPAPAPPPPVKNDLGGLSESSSDNSSSDSDSDDSDPDDPAPVKKPTPAPASTSTASSHPSAPANRHAPSMPSNLLDMPAMMSEPTAATATPPAAPTAAKSSTPAVLHDDLQLSESDDFDSSSSEGEL